jgi:thiol-disulfide isomerase/thioredoxin
MNLGSALHSAFGDRLRAEGELPSFRGASGWLNSEPLTMADLKGKVVLVDFWTYTCINWLRTLPYLRAWDERYRDEGLVLIGVHTPEFGFEHDLENVRRAVEEMRIEYPVAIDNDYAVWQAFDNHYWPALYFVDAEGQIRHHHFGEGEYEQSETAIRQLLAEAGAPKPAHGLVSVAAEGIEAAADWGDLRSPENYLGYDRSESFSSPGGPAVNERRLYDAPSHLGLNDWAVAGDWTITRRAAVPNEAGARILYRFHARDLHLVTGPAAKGDSVRIRVTIDGQPPGPAHGADIDEDGNGTLAGQRLYQLIRQPGPIADHTFELTFLDRGAEAYAFTFG